MLCKVIFILCFYIIGLNSIHIVVFFITLVCITYGKENMEESLVQAKLKDAFNQEKSEQIYADKENDNIVNATRLMELLILEPGPSNRSRSGKDSKQLPGTCILVLFYARSCVFSSQAAPHFNAIPRSFPYMKAVAIDAIKHQSFNAQYGIVGVPTLMLVHNGKPVAKFNDTVYTLESFAKFASHLTNLQSNGSLYVTSADFTGPVSSIPSNETDYCLVLSWIFNIACMLYFISRSRWWQQFVEVIQNTWRESNAQHEHAD
ncbi:PREDICTED: thioredoxin domain-containing protein 15 isoform X5 [Dinoponera quadriceps]|uniref:Thioredoxin domain-containing protein 15 isoform X5 n=1 Tax=Dinoponera quadriceps TaxID=609295 RepID=A0A6P3Y0U9_DINQU|nr:PREDICTED: thioredoxin domain-containing protein 15 isoform X5 [Dinoponera quadriceps]